MKYRAQVGATVPEGWREYEAESPAHAAALAAYGAGQWEHELCVFVELDRAKAHGNGAPLVVQSYRARVNRPTYGNDDPRVIVGAL